MMMKISNRKPWASDHLTSEEEQTISNQPREASIVAAIMRYLKTVPGCKAEKTHGGMYGKAGKPDITGCLRGWRFEFEVKRPGNSPTPLQEKTLRDWAAAGAVAAVCYSVDDAKEYINYMEKQLASIGK